MKLPSGPVRPQLDELIARVRTHIMTQEERRVQRRSWVIGELMLLYPEITREEAVAIVDKVEAER